MKFNISYMGPMDIFHVRRDLMLAIQYGLQECGHDAVISRCQIDDGRINILISGYFLSPKSAKELIDTKIPYIHLNTEIIANGMLNHRPDKCDFKGVYLPFMKNAKAAWDLIPQNISQYPQYGFEAKFMRWGYTDKLREIEHREKDVDFYFFGTMTERRYKILMALEKAGMVGLVDQQCPHFLRNDRIARSKVQLNLIQDTKYKHVTSTRTCYLSNNDCFIVSEPEEDLAGYLDSTSVVHTDKIVDFVRANKDNWKELGAANCEKFKTHRMKHVMAELLERSLG